MCTITRTKKLIVCLTLVSVPLGCTIFIRQVYSYEHHAANVSADVMYLVIYVVVPLAVLVVNVMLIRERRRASAANLGLQQHHNQSQSAVPTIMLVTTSLVYVALRGPLSIMALIQFYLSTSMLFYRCLDILNALSYFVFSYNFYVYLITGKQFRSDLHALFCRCSSSSTAAAHERNSSRLARSRQAETAI